MNLVGMNEEEFQKHLDTKYPLASSRKETCYKQRGLEIKSGWFPLIDECFSKIEARLNEMQLNQRRLHEFSLDQIKEKFGTLRFYHSYSFDEQISTFIVEAEHKSAETCEDCSAPGLTRPGRWIRTLCEPCLAKGFIDRLVSEVNPEDVKLGKPYEWSKKERMVFQPPKEWKEAMAKFLLSSFQAKEPIKHEVHPAVPATDADVDGTPVSGAV